MRINYEAIKNFITENHLRYDSSYKFNDDTVFLSFFVVNDGTFVHQEKIYLNERERCDKLLEKFEKWSEVMNADKKKYGKTIMELRWYDTVSDFNPYYVWNDRITNVYDYICTRFKDGRMENIDRWLISDNN